MAMGFAMSAHVFREKTLYIFVFRIENLTCNDKTALVLITPENA